MIKHLKPVFLFFLISITAIDCFSQQQPDFLSDLSEKFTRYCDLFPREEIFVHTDRQNFISGEDLWFGVYLLDRRSSKPSGESKIAYVEILNAENRPVVQKRIKLENGYGPGQVNLPDTLSSGLYTLRVYTNWMKNFLPDNCFSKSLNIFNYLNVKTSAENMKTGSTLTEFLKKRPGPVLLQPGIKIEVDRQDMQDIKLTINTDLNSLAGERNLLYLFVETHGVVNVKRTITLSSEITTVNIPRSLLIPGINHFTVFNASGKPVKEFYNYTPREDPQLITLTSDEVFGKRERITLDFETKNLPVNTDNAQRLSLSVAPAGEKSIPDLNDYMIFGSEFGVIPEEILKLDLNKISADSLTGFLSVLKSNWIDWNVILSGNYPEVKYRKESENHFLYGQLLNRKSQAPDEDRYLFLSMPSKNPTFQYARTDKNGHFTFKIPLDENIRDLIVQPEEVERGNTIKIESSFSDKYPVLHMVSDTSAVKSPENANRFGINYQVMMIYKSEDLPSVSSPVMPPPASKRFYGKPDIELVMDDYIKLPVMQEVFFELMPGVFLKKKKSEYEITIADPVDNRIFEYPPVMFIDGVVVNDPSVIANLDPELVEKVDAIKSRYFVGEYLFYGIVSIITRSGDFSNITLPDYAIRLPYRVTDPVKQFTSPQYPTREMKQSRIPDFRNTIYWNPSVKTGSDGKTKAEFWSSDLISDYIIDLQGITDDGTVISLKKFIKVR